MNKQRRAEIEKATALIDEAKDILGRAMADEQDYLDNMPESLRGGDKCQAAEETIGELESAISSLEEAIGSAQNATGE